jgi:hypothetical protein
VGLTATVCSTKAGEAQSLENRCVRKGLHDLHVILIWSLTKLVVAARGRKTRHCAPPPARAAIMGVVTPPHEETADQREDSATPPVKKWALASKYKSSTGIYQSLSLILNAGLMIYAHVGLSAVFVSNQQNIGNAVATAQQTDGSTAGQNDTSTTTTACTAGDQARWTSVIGPDGLTGANNKTYESSFCSTRYINPDTQGQCLVDAPCISKCFTTLFNYTESCADCFAAIPLCSLVDSCFVCSGSPQSPECYNCTLRCVRVFVLFCLLCSNKG